MISKAVWNYMQKADLQDLIDLIELAEDMKELAQAKASLALKYSDILKQEDE